MYRYCSLLLTASLLLLTGNSTAEPLSSSVDALEGPAAYDAASTRDDPSQRFSAALEAAEGGGGRALEVARRLALQPQLQSAVHRQQQHPHQQHHQQQQQLPTLELRPVFLSDHFIRQMSPSSSAVAGGKYSGGGQRVPQYYFKPIPRELMPLSSTFLSRGEETLRARRYTYPTASQSFLRFGRRYKRPKETKDTAFLRFGRSGGGGGGQTVVATVSDAEDDAGDQVMGGEQSGSGQQQPSEQTAHLPASTLTTGSEV